MQPVIAGRADAMLGGFLNVEGVELAEAAKTPGSSRSTSSASRPTTSWSWSPTPTALPRTPSRSSVPRRARARHGAAAADPAAATDALLAAGEGLDPT